MDRFKSIRIFARRDIENMILMTLRNEEEQKIKNRNK